MKNTGGAVVSPWSAIYIDLYKYAHQVYAIYLPTVTYSQFNIFMADVGAKAMSEFMPSDLKYMYGAGYGFSSTEQSTYQGQNDPPIHLSTQNGIILTNDALVGSLPFGANIRSWGFQSALHRDMVLINNYSAGIYPSRFFVPTKMVNYLNPYENGSVNTLTGTADWYPPGNPERSSSNILSATPTEIWKVDLGRVISVDNAQFGYNVRGGSTGYLFDVDFQYSEDGSAWTSFSDEPDQTAISNAYRWSFGSGAVSARYFRVMASVSQTASIGYLHLYHGVVWGEEGQ